MGKRWGHRRDDGGSMLATVIVIFGGAALCTLIAMLAPKRSEWLIGGVITIAILFVATVIRMRYSSGGGSSLGFWFSLKSNPADDGIAGQYRPRKVKNRADEAPSGTQRPITAQEVRDIKDTSANTWVPSRDTKSTTDD